MFDLSWSHIAILLVVALLVLGPKELPNAIRTGASLLRQARRMAGEFRSGVDELVREAELDETRRSIQRAMSEGVENTIAKQVDPAGEIKAAIEADPLAEAEAAETSSEAEIVIHDAPPAPPHSLEPPKAEPEEPRGVAAAISPAEEPAPVAVETATEPQAPEAPAAGAEGDMKKSA
jgi:sec-independent protein translocase protein TatB